MENEVEKTFTHGDGKWGLANDDAVFMYGVSFPVRWGRDKDCDLQFFRFGKWADVVPDESMDGYRLALRALVGPPQWERENPAESPRERIQAIGSELAKLSNESKAVSTELSAWGIAAANECELLREQVETLTLARDAARKAEASADAAMIRAVGERDELRSQLEAVKLECGVSKEACQTLREDSQEAAGESIVQPYVDDHPEVKTRLPHDRLDELEGRMQSLETQWIAASEHMPKAMAWTDMWSQHDDLLRVHRIHIDAHDARFDVIDDSVGTLEGRFDDMDLALKHHVEWVSGHMKGLGERVDFLDSEEFTNRIRRIIVQVMTRSCTDAQLGSKASPQTEVLAAVRRERDHLRNALSQLKKVFAQFQRDAAAERERISIDLTRANEVRHSAEEQSAKLVAENHALRRQAGDSPLPRSFYTAKDVELAEASSIGYAPKHDRVKQGSVANRLCRR
jgi:chromosome segregation ATPase